MQKKLHIKTGHTVLVIAGNNKGKKGRVPEFIAKPEGTIGEGVNMMKKSTKPNAATPQGGIVEKEAPVHISNLMLFDAKAGAATRVGRRLNDQGKLVRFSKKSGEEIK